MFSKFSPSLGNWTFEWQIFAEKCRTCAVRTENLSLVSVASIISAFWWHIRPYACVNPWMETSSCLGSLESLREFWGNLLGKVRGNSSSLAQTAETPESWWSSADSPQGSDRRFPCELSDPLYGAPGKEVSHMNWCMTYLLRLSAFRSLWSNSSVSGKQLSEDALNVALEIAIEFSSYTHS